MIVTPHLQAYYRFENNGLDSSGKGNHLTAVGATYGAGKVGNGIILDGVDDYGYLPLNSGNLYNSGTVCFWFKRTGNPGGGVYHPVYQRFNAAVVGIQIYIISNKLGIFTTGAVRDTGFTVPLNEWHHYLFSMSGTTTKVYIDGNLYITFTGMTFLDIPTASLYTIGNYMTSFANAQMDEVITYLSPLGETDAKRIYCGLHPLNG